MRKSLFSFIALVACAVLPSCSTPQGQAEGKGFQPLFNGKDFTGWYIISGHGAKNDDPNHLFQVHDGMIHMYKDAPDRSKQPFGYIVTEKEYSDYHLRFQYKWGTKKFAPKLKAKRDCGLLFHVVGNDGVWPRSVECQVQEGDTGDIFTVYTRVTTTVDPKTTNQSPNVVTNANTGVVKTNFSSQPYFMPASAGGVEMTQGTWEGVRRVHRSKSYDNNGWNTVEVIARGDSATYIINGKTNNGFLHLEQKVGDKWVPLTKGRILLQQEGAEVFYRNVEIKSLEAR